MWGSYLIIFHNISNISATASNYNLTANLPHSLYYIPSTYQPFKGFTPDNQAPFQMEARPGSSTSEQTTAFKHRSPSHFSLTNTGTVVSSCTSGSPVYQPAADLRWGELFKTFEKTDMLRLLAVSRAFCLFSIFSQEFRRCARNRIVKTCMMKLWLY